VSFLVRVALPRFVARKSRSSHCAPRLEEPPKGSSSKAGNGLARGRFCGIAPVGCREPVSARLLVRDAHGAVHSGDVRKNGIRARSGLSGIAPQGALSRVVRRTPLEFVPARVIASGGVVGSLPVIPSARVVPGEAKGLPGGGIVRSRYWVVLGSSKVPRRKATVSGLLEGCLALPARVMGQVSRVPWFAAARWPVCRKVAVQGAQGSSGRRREVATLDPGAAGPARESLSPVFTDRSWQSPQGGFRGRDRLRDAVRKVDFPPGSEIRTYQSMGLRALIPFRGKWRGRSLALTRSRGRGHLVSARCGVSPIHTDFGDH
jgi:hypothetical protein